MTKRRRRNGGRGFTPRRKDARRGVGSISKTSKRKTPQTAAAIDPFVWERQYLSKQKDAEGDATGSPKVPEQLGEMDEVETYGKIAARGEIVLEKRAPVKLQVRQSEVIDRLIGQYGEDVEGMARDMRLNPFQLSVGQLKKHIESFRYWGRRDFDPEAYVNVKKLRWFNDPLNPDKRFFVDKRS